MTDDVKTALSSNGRTPPFEGENLGSSPSGATKLECLQGLDAVDLLESRSLASIAVSLKRIADALDRP